MRNTRIRMSMPVPGMDSGSNSTSLLSRDAPLGTYKHTERPIVVSAVNRIACNGGNSASYMPPTTAIQRRSKCLWIALTRRSKSGFSSKSFSDLDKTSSHFAASARASKRKAAAPAFTAANKVST